MKDYIPSNNAKYNNWQENLVETVSTNEVVWAIDNTVVTQLQHNAGIYKPLYQAIVNKKRRTPQQVYAHDTYQKTYTKYLRGFVQAQLVNNALIKPNELVAMGLNPHLYIRTERPKITDFPAIALSIIGGGEIRFRCTMPGSNSKGRHPDSNGIELYYTLESLAKQVNPVEPNPKDSEEAAPSAEQFVPTIFSPKANFIHAFGINNVGKVLRVYGRWVNTSKKANSGTFSGISSIVIS